MTKHEYNWLNPNIPKLIAGMTEKNHHTEARLWIAENLLHDPGRTIHPLSRAYKALSILQDFYGSIPEELRPLENDLDTRLHDALKCRLSPTDFERVWRHL